MTLGLAEVLSLLEEARAAEEAQTRFYRALAGMASERDERSVERLNELLADEHHHLSRLTARIVELGGRAGPRGPRGFGVSDSEWSDWMEEARRREDEEVRRYRALLDRGGLDPETEALLGEILESELKHREELAGKWMSA